MTAVNTGLTASAVGASGFAGGELLRLVHAHPSFELVEATSRHHANRSIGHVHPNLRQLPLRFTDPTDLEEVDVRFTATPHGVAMANIGAFAETADRVVDLSADFRLADESAYDAWYDGHDAPGWLDEATYALPELNRAAIDDHTVLACGGCNATVTLLALHPLAEAGLLDEADPVVIDLKVGSSEGGAEGGTASSHAERTGVVRPYAPTGHRHEAEIEAHLDIEVSLTAHAVDMTRGASVTCHVFVDDPPARSDLWRIYRATYEQEPFIRLVAGGGGIYRYPEAKVVAGTNYCDVGFAVDDDRIVVFAALDNLMKGSAGQAVHAANVAFGLPETAGLAFSGLHPVGAP